jgi:hypothetical protein
MRTNDDRLGFGNQAKMLRQLRGSTSKAKIGNNRDQATGHQTVRVKPSGEVRQRRIAVITVRQCEQAGGKRQREPYLSSIDEPGDLVDRRMHRKARGKTQVDRRIQRQQGLRAMCLREASGKDGFKKPFSMFDVSRR